MTSVPKPLKFLRPHYTDLVAVFDRMAAGDNKKMFADILSVLGMTFGTKDKLETLKYRLVGSQEPLASWGHEYVR